MIDEVPKSAIEIDTRFRNFDPPVGLMIVNENSVKRGAFIPEVGVIEQIWEGLDDLTILDEATAREKPYVFQTRVTEECFPMCSKNLQKNMIEQMERRLQRFKELYEKWLDTEKVTVDDLYEEVEDYKKHLGLAKVDPKHDPVRMAYAPPPTS